MDWSSKFRVQANPRSLERVFTCSAVIDSTQHIISAATGHQVTNRGGAKYSISGKDYNSSRNHKLKQQFTAAAQPVEGEGGVAGSSGKQETFVVQSRIFGQSFPRVVVIEWSWQTDRK